MHLILRKVFTSVCRGVHEVKQPLAYLGTNSELRCSASLKSQPRRNKSRLQQQYDKKYLSVKGEENIVGRPRLEPRASCSRCEHFANLATEPLGHPLTFLPQWPPNVTGEEKSWPDRDSNPWPLSVPCKHSAR